MGFDVCKSYSSVLLNNKVDFPIFQQFDEVQEFNISLKLCPGEYYISKALKLTLGIVLSRGWYPLNMILFGISRGCIVK